MESIEYSSPQQAAEGGETPQHRFDLIVDGEKIGAAEIDYFSKPLPLYQVSDLYVDFEHKGKGYASQILSQVEEWITSRGKPGVLVDAVMEGDDASGMYVRRGWMSVPNTPGLHVFNWPADVSLSVLDGYAMRHTDMTEREAFKKSIG
jgi:GNAT superfamily N-acetyltransferase